MTIQEIRLTKGAWTYDDTQPLGTPGGFGAVFRGADDKGLAVAVKRLHITAAQAAHRELKIGARIAEQSYAHVVPVLDHGQDANSDRYFLVMPICARSLAEEIKNSPNLP